VDLLAISERRLHDESNDVLPISATGALLKDYSSTRTRPRPRPSCISSVRQPGHHIRLERHHILVVRDRRQTINMPARLAYITEVFLPVVLSAFSPSSARPQTDHNSRSVTPGLLQRCSFGLPASKLASLLMSSIQLLLCRIGFRSQR